MKTVLAMDTSTEWASIALRRGDTLLWEREISSQRSHSAALFPALAEAASVGPRIDRIVVGLGPGSFAGIRIAIAAALGLQAVWKSELVGVPSALAMASNASCFAVVGDARRGTWYYSRVERGECVEGPQLIESDEALAKILLDRAFARDLLRDFQREHHHFIGPEGLVLASGGDPDDLAGGSSLVDLFCTDASATRWGARIARPKAAYLASLAYAERSIRQIGNLEPLYLREPHITAPKTQTVLSRTPQND